jgi:hypothetical protein
MHGRSEDDKDADASQDRTATHLPNAYNLVEMLGLSGGPAQWQLQCFAMRSARSND